MFFVGLNIGIFFCVLGFFFNGMLGIVFFVFFVGIVDIGCVVFIVVLRLVVIVGLFLMMEMLVDVVDGWVGVILVDFLDLVVFIKVNCGNMYVKNWKGIYGKVLNLFIIKMLMDDVNVNRWR